MAKNVFLILDSNTQVIVGHTTTQEGRMTLTQGALVGKVEPGTGSTGPWEFETPLGVCAIRGTEFAILHSEAHGTHLGVFKGEVQLSPAESATEDYPAVVISAHQEGVLEKHKPLKTLAAYSTLMHGQFAQVTRLRKRYPQVAAVWVLPMTPDYRKSSPGKIRDAREKPSRISGPKRARRKRSYLMQLSEKDLERVFEATRAITSTLRLSEVLETVMRLASEVARAEASALLLLDPATDELFFDVALGEKGGALQQVRLKKGEGIIAGWVADE